MTTFPSSEANTPKNCTLWWIGTGLVLGVIAVYWPVAGYGFLDYDDWQYIQGNPQVRAGLSWTGVVWAFTTYYAANWHPLTWLSHMLDVQLFGMHAGGHHATSVLLHAANTVLLFLLLKRLTGAIWRSALVAALFGFHPLHVESVAWVAERKDVLSTFFFLLTLIAYAQYVAGCQQTAARQSSANRPPALFYGLALLFFALGLMSKPMLVTLPFVLLLLDFWPLQRCVFPSPSPGQPSPGSPWAMFFRLFVEKTPFFVFSAASCVVTILAQKNGQALATISDLPLDGRLQNAVVSCSLYLEKAFWPAHLVVFYPYTMKEPESTAIAAFVLVLISGVAFISLRRRPYLIVGWLWFLGTLLPVIGLVQVGMQAMADRYTYIPLIGLFIAITWSLGDLQPGWRYRRAAMMIVSVVVLGICLMLTAAQVRWWRNSETLSRHALAVTTNNVPMQILLGDTLLRQKKSEEAVEHFAEAARIWPASAVVQSKLAAGLAAEGRTDEAIAAYRTALKINPHDASPHYLLGNLLANQGKHEEAVQEYEAALQEDSNLLFALNDLAWLLATAPDSRFRNGTEAVKLAEKACQLTDFKAPQFVGTLAAAYAEAGRFDDAIKTAGMAITLATADGKEALAAKNRELLELYRSQKAYHKPAAH